MKRLIDEQQIGRRVAQLGRQIADDYADRTVTALGVLTGSIIFLADLIRNIDLPLRVGVIQASSYRGRSTEPGSLVINTEFLPELADRHILLVDDIFDTGHTLSSLVQAIQEQRPASLRTVVLLWKQGRSQVELRPDYFGFQIPDEFVVGYGLDYNDEYRHWPDIAALEETDL